MVSVDSFLNISLLFCTYCFIGWVWESIYQSIIDRKILNRGFLFGPYIPIYGFGGVGIYLLFQKYGTTDLTSIRSLQIFIFGLLVATTLEYLTSFILEKIFGAKWWDYSNYFMNINGRICLIASLFWGFVAVLFVQILNPNIYSKISNIPYDLRLVLTSVIGTAMIIDTFYTLFSLINLKDKIDAIIEVQDAKLANTIDRIQGLPGSSKQFIVDSMGRFYGSDKFFMRRLINAFPKLKFKSKEKQKIFERIRENLRNKKER